MIILTGFILGVGWGGGGGYVVTLTQCACCPHGISNNVSIKCQGVIN